MARVSTKCSVAHRTKGAKLSHPKKHSPRMCPQCFLFPIWSPDRTEADIPAGPVRVPHHRPQSPRKTGSSAPEAVPVGPRGRSRAHRARSHGCRNRLPGLLLVGFVGRDLFAWESNAAMQTPVPRSPGPVARPGTGPGIPGMCPGLSGTLTCTSNVM